METKSSGSTGMAGLVAALMLWTGALACGPTDDPVSGRDFGDLPADQVMFDMDYDVRDMGTLRARLHADTAWVWEDSARTLLFPVDLELYDENGTLNATLTADEGELNTRNNRMVARGNVVLVTAESERRILTEELHYDPNTGRIWSDVPTIMFTGETRVDGEGFTSDDRMRNVEISKARGENLEFEF